MDRTTYHCEGTGKALASPQGELAIGCFASICRNRLADELLAFARECPDVELGMHEMTRASLLPALRKGELTLAILPGTDHPDLQSTALWQDQVMVAVHSAHPLALAQSIDPAELLGEIFLVSRQQHGGDMHRFLLQHIFPQEPSLNSVLVDLSQNRLMEEVAAGRGISLVCGSHSDLASPAVTLCPVTIPDAHFWVRAYWAAGRPEGPLATLIALLRAGRIGTPDAPITPR